MTVARASASAASNQICHTQNHFLSISALENVTSSALYFLESFRFSLISNRLSNTSEARLKSFARAGGEGAEREEFGHEKTSSAQYYHIQAFYTAYTTNTNTTTSLSELTYRSACCERQPILVSKKKPTKRRKRISAGKSERLINTLRQFEMCFPQISPSSMSLTLVSGPRVDVSEETLHTLATQCSADLRASTGNGRRRRRRERP